MDEPIRIDAVTPNGHVYWSTHCRHDNHKACAASSLTGTIVGDRVTVEVDRNPAQCKGCAAPCVCLCHDPRGRPAAWVAARAVARAGRAINDNGELWWLHECGTPMASLERPGPHACAACDHAPAPWRALWTRTETNHG